ncbi:UDP-N-acetylmuramate dehydrogenase [Vibrio ostreicida]|uniref:UDP-N-acetylmuramate dehydrogenase n=1 Tax=Vibrio ostreicida TaxID=526588 RepID=UPI00097093C2|nr:FAD-binding protein [Vibrio ostreicida]
MLDSISLKKNYDISDKSHVKIGGTFDVVYFPRNSEQLLVLLDYLKLNNSSYFILGNLSNVLIRDGRIKTPGISLKYFKKIEFDDHKIVIGAGALMPALAVTLIKKNIKGFEGLVGIPGTVGGGIYMNASSYGSCISDFIESVTVINRDGDVRTLAKVDCSFGWRTSIFQNVEFANSIIIECTLSGFDDKSMDSITHRMNEIKEMRGSYQEKKYPNLGSTFSTKNIYKDIFKNSKVDRVSEFLIRVISKLCRDRHESYSRMIRSYTLLTRKIPKTLSENISEHTLNCFINRGLCFDDFKNNILTFKELTKLDTDLEIEIIEDIE